MAAFEAFLLGLGVGPATLTGSRPEAVAFSHSVPRFPPLLSVLLVHSARQAVVQLSMIRFGEGEGLQEVAAFSPGVPGLLPLRTSQRGS